MAIEKKYGKNTELVHAGNKPEDNHGIVNPPVYHASTILFPTYKAYKERGRARYRYGRMGTPTSDAFEDAIARMEGGYKAVSYPSGVAAITGALLAFVKQGDHILMTDTVYEPTRFFCDYTLKRMGIETEYYDPLIGQAIAGLIRENTALIFMESPGSGTFEVQDVPAIAAVAREKGVKTLIDNTWATPLLFNPHSHGVDVVIHAATKYIVGHSDVMLGVAVCRDAAIYGQVKETAVLLGACAGPDDLYLGLRGLRTMGVRLKQCAANALEIARWLQDRPEVTRVFYPALPEDPNHALWKRDFNGANGVLSFLLLPVDESAIEAFADALNLFPIGSSWGGYESLMRPEDMHNARTAVPWTEKGQLIRLQIGLEDTADLIADLETGFAAFNKAR